MIYSEPISLVPADDWSEVVNLFQQDGTTPLNLTGWTITKAEVRTKEGDLTIALTVDPSQLPAGKIPISASKTITDDLPMGNISEMEIEGISPAGLTRTLYFNDVAGVDVATTNIITVSHVGIQGPAGFRWRDDWATATAYLVSDLVYVDGSLYIAKAAHTSGALTEPGVGANWQTVWDLFLLGADEESIAIVAANIASVIAVGGSIGAVNTVAPHVFAIETVAPYVVQIGVVAMNIDEVITVAGIAAAVVAVAGNAANINTVAGIAANVTTVAGIAGNVTIVAGIAGDIATVVANIVAIQNAAANAAAAAASAAAALTSENNAEAAEVSAAISAALEDAGAAIYHATTIALGGYIMDLAARSNQRLTDVYATVLGDPAEEIDFYLAINGAMVYGPVTVVVGTPLHASGLTIDRDKGESLQVFLTYQSGTPTDFMVKVLGAAQP